MKIAEGLKRRIPRTFLGRVLAALLIYIALALAESLFLSNVVDRYLLSRTEIFEDYVARLSKPFVFPDIKSGTLKNCEAHDVALVYQFVLCADYAMLLPDCGRPNYSLLYIGPRSYFNPFSGDEWDIFIYGTNVLQFDANGRICHRYLEK